MSLPRILVLATGGTIAGRAAAPGSVTDYKAGEIAAETLLAAVPQLADTARVEYAQIANIPSEHMTNVVWSDLVKAVRGGVDSAVDGIVILHGTDTMEETAFFLDCVLGAECPVPIVLTGAMLPADALSADGPANILNAVRVAACAEAAGMGALVSFANSLHAASRVYKADSLALDAFRSAGGGCAGVVVDGEVRFGNVPGEWVWPELWLEEEFENLPAVGIMYGHAGMDEKTAAAFLAAEWRGIIHAGVGMGNMHAAARGALLDAVRRGVPVVCSSRVDGALAVMGARDRADGFVCANRLNPQKARVLLQLALHSSGDVSTELLQTHFDLYV